MLISAVAVLLAAVAVNAAETFPAYRFSVVAGEPDIGGSSDGAGRAARFLRAWSAVRDASGNVYVADEGNATIRKMTPDGTVSTLAGTAGLRGQVDGMGGAARFEGPRSIAIAPDGNLYVLSGDSFIRKITPAGNVTTVVSGLALVRAMAVDAAGTVYFADHRSIRRIDGGATAIVAGSATLEGSGDGLAAEATFNDIRNIAFSPQGELYIADRARIRRLSPDGTVSTVAGSSTMGYRDGTGSSAQFLNLSGFSFDASGNVFITNGETVRLMRPSGEVVTIGGTGTPYSPAREGVGRGARFTPGGIVVDSAGTLTIVGRNAVWRGVRTDEVAPPDITDGYLKQNLEIRAGTSATFTSAAVGTNLAYQWKLNNVAIPGATGPTLTVDSATASSAGTYDVQATNAAGSIARSIGTLAVFTPEVTSFVPRRSVPGGRILWGIASGGGRLVAVGTEGVILLSTDGVSWTEASSGVSDWLTAVTYDGTRFVAVGDNGRILFSTADAATWTPVQSGTQNRLNNVIATNVSSHRYVAVGEAGTIIVSPDGTNWSAEDSKTTGWLRGLAYDGSTLIVSGQGGVLRVSDPSGASILQPRSPNWGPAGTGRDDLEASAYISGGVWGGAVVSIGSSGTEIDWQRITALGGWSTSTFQTATNVRLRGLAAGANTLFATGENGVILTARAPGTTWWPLDSGTTANLVSAAYFNNALFVVGSDETILQSSPFYNSRAMNIATRGRVGTGEDILISGFVITGNAPKRVLVRAAGPALTKLGLTDVLPASRLKIFHNGSEIRSNTGWSTGGQATIAEVAAGVGAFPFEPGSGDSAIVATLDPGLYTAQVSGVNDATGLALVEVYDADPLALSGSKVVNLSTRGRVGTGADVLIAGFVIDGTASRRVLIRAAGPSLASQGIAAPLAQPRLELYNRDRNIVQTAAAWSSDPAADELQAAAAASGAFPFPADSADAAMVATLAPGSWTAHVSGADGGSGVALVEVYDLP